MLNIALFYCLILANTLTLQSKKSIILLHLYMNNQIQIFNNPQFGEVRVTMGADNEPRFCLADVCKVLNLTTHKVVQRLDGEGILSKYPLLTAGGQQLANFVNEDGLYDVILDSRKKEAKVFRKWVTSEVLPSIRKTGGYMVAKDNETEEELMARAMVVAQSTIARQQERLKSLQEANEEKDSQIAFLETDNEMQREQIAKQDKTLKVALPKAEYFDKVLNSQGTLCTTQISKAFGMSGAAYNKKLRDAGLQYRLNDQWVLKQPYSDWNLAQTKMFQFIHSDGRGEVKGQTVWNARGVYFLRLLHENDYDLSKTARRFKEIIHDNAQVAQVL